MISSILNTNLLQEFGGVESGMPIVSLSYHPNIHRKEKVDGLIISRDRRAPSLDIHSCWRSHAGSTGRYFQEISSPSSCIVVSDAQYD